LNRQLSSAGDQALGAVAGVVASLFSSDWMIAGMMIPTKK
jgi:hypothetical protein